MHRRQRENGRWHQRQDEKQRHSSQIAMMRQQLLHQWMRLQLVRFASLLTPPACSLASNGSADWIATSECGEADGCERARGREVRAVARVKSSCDDGSVAERAREQADKAICNQPAERRTRMSSALSRASEQQDTFHYRTAESGRSRQSRSPATRSIARSIQARKFSAHNENQRVN